MNRKQKLISENLKKLLVKQLAHELKNYNLYKQFANYYKVAGIDELGEYFNKRADEELVHHNWLFDYLTDGDVEFQYPAIEANNVTVKNHLEPFQLTVDREIETTNLIYDLYEAAKAEKDYMTMIWMERPLLFEQIEEENTSRTALGIMEEDADIFIKAGRILKLLEK
jgi:ferritin